MEESFKITPKGVICAILIEYGVPNYLEVTDGLWEKLYEFGCEEIGETGLPALVIEKSTGGTFTSVTRKLEE